MSDISYPYDDHYLSSLHEFIRTILNLVIRTLMEELYDELFTTIKKKCL